MNDFCCPYRLTQSSDFIVMNDWRITSYGGVDNCISCLYACLNRSGVVIYLQEVSFLC